MNTLAKRLKLAREEAGLSQAALAKLIGAGQSTIGSIENGRNHGSGKIVQIARALNVRPQWLEDGTLPMRDGGVTQDYNVESAPRMADPVPLISWVQAGDWCGVVDNFAPGDAEEWLPCPRSHGPHAFALRVRGVSMEPKYRNGSIIFVDPDKHADHGSNVVVRIENDKEATFKQLVIEGDKRFLKPLNPNWPEQLIEITEHATICGVVIGQFIAD